jgi:hypothetical protein
MPSRSKSRRSRNRNKTTNRPSKRGGDSHSAVFSPLVEKVGQSGGGVLFPASFDNVPIRSFYSQNTYNSDPGYLTMNARNTGSFYGGRKRSVHKRKHQSKKRVQQRGGAWPSVPQIPQLRMPTSNLYDSMNPPRESS